MSRPLVAIVGRPNVGKSMLFNRLAGRRLSIVEDTPGVTRDRLYAECEWNGRKFDIVDTGGIEPSTDNEILLFMREQAQIAIDAADVIVFVTEIGTGVTAADREVANMLLRSKKPVILCGDLNVAHEDIDLKNPGPNRGAAGFSDQERGKLGELLAAGFTDSFRHLHPDATGMYSWWSMRFRARERNAGWRIDYFLVSSRLADKIEKAEILMDVMGSDHCPVELDLTL